MVRQRPEKRAEVVAGNAADVTLALPAQSSGPPRSTQAERLGAVCLRRLRLGVKTQRMVKAVEIGPAYGPSGFVRGGRLDSPEVRPPGAASSPAGMTLMSPHLSTILRDSVVAVIQRPWRSLLLAGCTLAVVVVAWRMAPRSYSSEAKLFVRVGRETVTLDPTATTGQTISIYEARETELNSALDILSSRAIHEMVVDRLGAAVVLGKARLPAQTLDPQPDPVRVAASRSTAQEIAAKPAPVRSQRMPRTRAISDEAVVTENATSASRSSEQEPVTVMGSGPSPVDQTTRETAVQNLARMVSVAQGKKSGVITVTANAESPELAQRILQTTIDSFRVQHLRMNHTAGSYEFFVEQVAEGKRQLSRASEELRQAKDRLGISSIEGQRKLLQDQLGALATARLEASSLLATSEATGKELRKGLNRIPALLVSQETTGLMADGRDRTRQALAELELREQQLLVKYTEVHPEVVSIRQQIARARALLQSPPGDTASRTRTPNPVAQQLEIRIAEEEARREASRARSEILMADTRAVQSRLETLNASEGEIQRLEKQVETLQASLKSYTEKTEQARINQRLEEERISNINVVQPPTLSSKANSPNGKTVFLLGGVLAVLSGVGLPFGWELGRRGGPLLLAALAAPPGGV